LQSVEICLYNYVLLTFSISQSNARHTRGTSRPKFHELSTEAPLTALAAAEHLAVWFCGALLARTVPLVCQMKSPRRRENLRGLGITGAVGRNRTGDLLITKRTNLSISNTSQSHTAVVPSRSSRQLVLPRCELLQLFSPQCAASVPPMTAVSQSFTYGFIGDFQFVRLIFARCRWHFSK